MKQLQAIFSGQVQGVGFRAFTYELAKNLRLAGFVKNLADGRVEVLAEGEDVDLDKLVAEINKNFQISNSEISRSNPSQKFSSFEIIL